MSEIPANIPHPANRGRQQPNPAAYTIASTRYANEAGTAVNVQIDRGTVIQATQADTPALWAAVQARGNIAAYQAIPLSRTASLIYRRQRERAYLNRLAKREETEITYERTLGDVLDILITEVEVIRQHAGATATPEYGALLTEIVAIKAEFPKPT